ncbi:MAG: hypothetical protein JXA69_02920 [Phycisphaerae bacterium]|nr:hypothetical protein [Phycisphaerae bacterium]
MEFDDTQKAELEHNERWLDAMMRPAESETTTARAREAVRVALDEQWLGQYAAPLPSAATVARVKALVRHELTASHPPARYRIFGALAAAAAIAIAVGISRFAAWTPQEPAAIGDAFVSAWEALPVDEDLAAVTIDLAWVADEMETQTSSLQLRDDELKLEQLQDRIDRLFSEPADLLGTS